MRAHLQSNVRMTLTRVEMGEGWLHRVFAEADFRVMPRPSGRAAE